MNTASAILNLRIRTPENYQAVMNAYKKFIREQYTKVFLTSKLKTLLAYIWAIASLGILLELVFLFKLHDLHGDFLGAVLKTKDTLIWYLTWIFHLGLDRIPERFCSLCLVSSISIATFLKTNVLSINQSNTPATTIILSKRDFKGISKNLKEEQKLLLKELMWIYPIDNNQKSKDKAYHHTLEKTYFNLKAIMQLNDSIWQKTHVELIQSVKEQEVFLNMTSGQNKRKTSKLL